MTESISTLYTEDEPLLRIEKVSKSYGSGFPAKLILREVSATIRDIHRQGEVTGQNPSRTRTPFFRPRSPG
jgi:hypothetical protein